MPARVAGKIEVSRGLPATLLAKYFDPQGAQWQLKSDIRAMVRFQEINLAQPWPALPRAWIWCCCRNVMIYFDVPMKKTILGRLARLLHRTFICCWAAGRPLTWTFPSSA